jgi:hypothetical protein
MALLRSGTLWNVPRAASRGSLRGPLPRAHPEDAARGPLRTRDRSRCRFGRGEAGGRERGAKPRRNRAGIPHETRPAHAASRGSRRPRGEPHRCVLARPGRRTAALRHACSSRRTRLQSCTDRSSFAAPCHARRRGGARYSVRGPEDGSKPRMIATMASSACADRSEARPSGCVELDERASSRSTCHGRRTFCVRRAGDRRFVREGDCL